MQDKNPIIVFETYNSSIDANIVKAKLDAFGIPCFLSEENLTMLTTPILSGGIRLHLFEEDREQANEILLSGLIQKSDEDDLITCPNCRSKRILNVSREQFDPAKIVKYILQLSKRHYCLDCEAEFDY
jgi:DNA-directed RNA polymerase subunit RPC12/RpoP